MKGLSVLQAKRYGVYGCPPQTTLLRAAHQMAEESISCLIVTDAAGVMHGIVTRTDLLRAHMDAVDWSTTPVEDYMSRHVLSVSPTAPLEEAIDIVLRQRIDRVVVVDTETQRPLAVVSTWDMVNALMNAQ